MKPVNARWVVGLALRWVGGLALSLLAACGGGGGGGTAAPTVTAVPTASKTATAVPTPIPSPTATLAATPSATAVPSQTATLPPTIPPSATPVPTFTSTPPPTDTVTPAPTETFTLTATPTDTPSPVPTSSPTQTPLSGPIVSAFGIADASGTFNTAIGTDPIFVRHEPAGFIIYVEGRPGVGGLPVGTDLVATRPGDPTRQPDLQIESSNNLGNGSAEVCDNSFPHLGGVPGLSAVDFSPVQSVSDALNDLSCRFKVYGETDFACTQDNSGNFLFGNVSSTVQFCTLVSDTLFFPPGRTVLTARLLDVAGNAGPSVQITVAVIVGG